MARMVQCRARKSSRPIPARLVDSCDGTSAKCGSCARFSPLAYCLSWLPVLAIPGPTVSPVLVRGPLRPPPRSLRLTLPRCPASPRQVRPMDQASGRATETAGSGDTTDKRNPPPARCGQRDSVRQAVLIYRRAMARRISAEPSATLATQTVPRAPFAAASPAACSAHGHKHARPRQSYRNPPPAHRPSCHFPPAGPSS